MIKPAPFRLAIPAVLLVTCSAIAAEAPEKPGHPADLSRLGYFPSKGHFDLGLEMGYSTQGDRFWDDDSPSLTTQTRTQNLTQTLSASVGLGSLISLHASASFDFQNQTQTDATGARGIVLAQGPLDPSFGLSLRASDSESGLRLMLVATPSFFQSKSGASAQLKGLPAYGATILTGWLQYFWSAGAHEFEAEAGMISVLSGTGVDSEGNLARSTEAFNVPQLGLNYRAHLSQDFFASAGLGASLGHTEKQTLYPRTAPAYVASTELPLLMTYSLDAGRVLVDGTVVGVGYSLAPASAKTSYPDLGLNLQTIDESTTHSVTLYLQRAI